MVVVYDTSKSCLDCSSYVETSLLYFQGLMLLLFYVIMDRQVS